jgi:hypothetical protein
MAKTEDQSNESIVTQADRLIAELPSVAAPPCSNSSNTQSFRKQSTLYVILSGADIYSHNRFAFIFYRLSWGGLLIWFFYRYFRVRHKAWQELLRERFKHI